MKLYGGLMQIPGMDVQEMTMSENMAFIWDETGFMRWPLALCVIIGFVVIIWKFVDLTRKSLATRKILSEVDGLLSENRIDEAMEAASASNAPAARILYAGMERADEGSERVNKAIENEGLIQLSKLESGLVVLATLTNVAPLLGFLGTVIGMIVTFQAITLFGTGDPKTMAGGISQALITTVLGLTVAIPTVLLHSIVDSRAKGILHVLTEQSAGLVAEHAEATSK